jgi:type VI secretion system secreted protein VgrG
MLPRVNEEVIIAYLDGDPDQPIIVGRVHNAVVTSPLNLPEEQTRSEWRSQSTPGGDGFNSIMMEDAKGAELLVLKAERDYVTQIGRRNTTRIAENDATEIGGDQKLTVQGARSTTTLAGETKQVQGNRKTTVTGDDNLTVTGGLVVKSKLLIMTGDDSVDLNGKQITITGGDSIKLCVGGKGGSSIEITAGEIKLVSPLINLNP